MKTIFYTAALTLLLYACGDQASDHTDDKHSNEVVQQKTDIIKEDTVVVVPDTIIRGYENPVSDLGIGFIIAPQEVTLFNDQDLTEEYMTFNTFEELPEEVIPFHYAPQDTLMHFICLNYSKSAIEVLVNFDEVKYLKWKKPYKLKKWGSYIFQSFGVQRKMNEEGKPLMNNEFRAFNNETAEVLDIAPGNELFCPVKVNGEWLKVKYDCTASSYEGHGEEPCLNYINQCENLKTGWIRWKKNNVFLLKVFSNF